MGRKAAAAAAMRKRPNTATMTGHVEDSTAVQQVPNDAARQQAGNACQFLFQLSWAGHMMRATAPVSFFHFDSSARSCFFPAAVRR